MKTFKTWIQLNEGNNYSEEAMALLLREAPHTAFVGPFPHGFEFLDGSIADLGFEDLGLSDPEQFQLHQGFSGRGILVPGTRHRLRTERAMRSLVEPADGTETVTFPPHWKQAVLVIVNRNDMQYIGKKVREARTGPVDHSLYTDTGEAWVRKAPFPA